MICFCFKVSNISILQFDSTDCLMCLHQNFSMIFLAIRTCYVRSFFFYLEFSILQDLVFQVKTYFTLCLLIFCCFLFFLTHYFVVINTVFTYQTPSNQYLFNLNQNACVLFITLTFLKYVMIDRLLYFVFLLI